MNSIERRPHLYGGCRGATNDTNCHELFARICEIHVIHEGILHEEKMSMKKTRRYGIEQFMRTIKITGGSFSHDEESILFNSDATGIFNVYSVPVSGGLPRQLTHSIACHTYGVSCFPNDPRLLLARDHNGDENYQIYISEPDGTEHTLTPESNAIHRFLGWSYDEQFFYFSTNGRDPRFFDIYKMDVASLERSLIYQDTVGYYFNSISRDEEHIAFIKSNNREDTDICLYNTKTRALKNITPHEGDVYNVPASFDPDSKCLYIVTNQNSDFRYIVRYEQATGEIEIAERDACDVNTTYFSHNGKYRVVIVDKGGRAIFKLYERATGESVDLPNIPDEDVSGVVISRSEKKVLLSTGSDRAPANLYLYDLDSGQARRLTESLNPEINSEDLVDSKIICYRSFDGLEIPSLLWKPHQASSTNKAPALVWVHGGPGGQTRKGYSALIQYLVNHGYVVLGVNHRGSSGYGKKFLAADNRKHGREPLWDCIEAKKYLAELDYVDISKVGIIGGSYGGYMVLAALAFHPEEFAVGIDMYGIANWLRIIESFPKHWEPFLEGIYKKVGNPKTDKEMLRAISPLFHAAKIVKPLMVIQGANDPRVLKVESDEIVEAIERKQGIVEYIVFPDEGHGISKKANKIRAYSAILSFLERHLKAIV
jgi:dipeptidyl aminopeptidase/acylaminoacyl peptidase